MKLMPASRALATMRDDVASSVGPPNIMVPKQIGEIFRPLRPSWRYCMERSSWWVPSFRGDAKHRTRNLEIQGLVLADHPGMTEKRYASLFMILNTPLAIAIQRLSTVTSVVMKI